MSYRIRTVTKSSSILDDQQLLSGGDRLLFWIQDHRTGIFGSVAAVVLAAVAVGGVVWYDGRQAEQAAELSHQATKLYLDRPADQQAKADENLKKAISLYRQLVEQYPRSPSARLAFFQLGNALVHGNELKPAIEAYQKFIADYGNNKALLGLVYQRLAYAQLLNGDKDQAVKTFTALLEVPGAVNKDHVLFELGKLEETQGRPEGALARYQDLVKSYPNSPLVAEASKRVDILGGKKVAGPPSPAGTPSAPEEHTKK